MDRLRLYIHVPFCVGKCTYCSFYSEIYHPDQAKLYVHQVLDELAVRAGQLEESRLESVYFGGGTPSVLGVDQLGAILEGVRQHFILDQAEITVEANPESALRPGFLSGLVDLGVNRLSLGVQSFQDKWLQLLGRPHSGQEAEAAVGLARSAGLINISLDLIWGLPGQTPENWLRDLRQAVALGPEHLSCYGLSLKEDAPLAACVASGALTLPDDEISAVMYEQGSEFLESQGLRHYEISSYAQPRQESQHNCGYWAQDEYLGLGPGAVSTCGGRRWSNPEDLFLYADLVAAGCPKPGEEIISSRLDWQEMVMLSLRLRDGLDLKRFKVKTGHDFLHFAQVPVEQLCSRGLARLSSGHFQLTLKGMLVSNSIIALVLDSLESMPEHTETI